jgi:hypothetical protein
VRSTKGGKKAKFPNLTLLFLDCGLYVCQQCLTNDPQYCGVCSSGQVCTLSSACSATWQTSGTISCPVAGAVVPRSGSTDGGDFITITGQFLDNSELLDASQTSCTFGSASPVTATNVAATFIQCRSPSSSGAYYTNDTHISALLIAEI